VVKDGIFVITVKSIMICNSQFTCLASDLCLKSEAHTTENIAIGEMPFKKGLNCIAFEAKIDLRGQMRLVIKHSETLLGFIFGKSLSRSHILVY